MATVIDLLVRTRDESTRVLRRMAGEIDRTGREVDTLSRQFDRLTRATSDFMVAAGGGTLVVRLGAGAFKDLADYETRMVAIAKTTNMSKLQTESFGRQIDATARQLSGIDPKALQEVAIIAGQLGIRGSRDLLKFSATMAKLSKASPVEGEQGAAQIAQVMGLSKTPITQVGKFADVLVKLGNNSQVADAENRILDISTVLAQATSRYKIAYQDLLGMSATGAELGFKPELFASVIGRTLGQLQIAAEANTPAMRDLTKMTGLSADAFGDMIKNSPVDALEVLLQTMKAISDAGGSYNQLLQGFGLYAEENQRVMGTLSEAQEMRKKGLSLARIEARQTEENGALNAEYSATIDTLNNKWANMAEAAGFAQRALTLAVAPEAKSLLDSLTETINDLTDKFRMLDPETQTLTVQMGFLAAAAIPAAAGIRLVGMAAMFALRGPAMLVLGLGRLAAQMAILAVGGPALVAGLAGLTIGTGLSMGVTALAETIREKYPEIAAGVDALMGKAGVLRDLADFLNTNPFSGEIEYGPNKGKPYLAKDSERESYAIIQSEKSKRKELKKTYEEMRSQAAAGQYPGAPADLNIKPQMSIDATSDKELQKLDDWTDKLKAVEAAQHAVEAAMRLVSKQQEAGMDISYDSQTLARYKARVKVLARTADPTEQLKYDVERSNEDQVASFDGQAGRDILEIDRAIIDLKEKKGTLLEKEKQDVTDILKVLQQSRALNAVLDSTRDTDNELALARQRNSIGQQNVQIEQQINELIRTRTGEYYPEEIAALKEKLKLVADTNALNQLTDRLDPITEANRTYLDDITRLNAALATRNITQAQYNAMVTQLNLQTLAARNPLGQFAKDGLEEISVLRFRGDQQEIERQVLTNINQLRQQGVEIEEKHVAAMREYVTALYQANEAASHGLQAWADGFGSFQKQLGSLQENIASSVSDGLVDGFTGGDPKQALNNFLKTASKAMVKTAVDYFLAEGIKKFGGDNGKGAALDAAAKAAGKIDGLGMTTPSVSIQAGSVTVTGYGPVGAGADSPAKAFEKILAKPGSERVGSTIDFKSALSSVSATTGAGKGNYEAMLRAAATKWGVNPDSAVKLANYEGGLDSWVQSNSRNKQGIREPSYGPMQMLVGGEGTGFGKGMGNAFMAKTGMDPRDPSSAPQYFDYAMEHASKKGWGEWYGARDNGMSNMEGIGANPPQPNIDMSQFNASVASGQAAASQAAAGQTQLASTLQQTTPAAQQAGNSVQQMNSKMQTATPAVGGLGTNVGSLEGAAGAATPGIQGLGQGLMGLVQQIGGALGGGGGAGGGIGGIFSLFTSFLTLHGGGSVGNGGGTSGLALAGSWAGAQRHHGGTKGIKQDEYRALLKKNERVLTEADDQRTMGVLRGKAGGGGSSTNVFAPNIPITVQASGNKETDAAMAERLSKEMDTLLEQKMTEFTMDQQRPGNMMNKSRFV